VIILGLLLPVSATADLQWSDIDVLPDVSMRWNQEAFLVNQFGYSYVLDRTVSVDVLRIYDAVFSFAIGQEIVTDGPDAEVLEPALITYDLAYFDIRWEFAHFAASIFSDHICINNLNNSVSQLRRFRWYGYGVKLTTRGMIPGQESSGIRFGITDRRLLSFSANAFLSAARGWRPFDSQDFKYDYLIRAGGNLRWHPLPRVSPYVDVRLTGIVDDEFRVNTIAELGVRGRLSTAVLIGYLQYERRHDADGPKGTTADYVRGGIGFETSAGRVAQAVPISPDNGTLAAVQVLPEAHGSLAYGEFLNDDLVYQRGEVVVGADLLRIPPVSLFVESDLSHDSAVWDNGFYRGLSPKWLLLHLDAGLAYDLDPARFSLLYRFGSMDDGNNWYAQREEFHHVLARASLALEPPPSNRTFRFTNRLHATAYGGPTVASRGVDYAWLVGGELRWEPFALWSLSPFFRGDGGIRFGREDWWEANLEAGLRIDRAADLEVYYRLVLRSEPDTANGRRRVHHLLSLRTSF